MVTRPMMRYHGGKWRIAPWIIAQFPPHRVYVEPYAGGASIFFRKPRSFHEVINDLNDDLVNIYRVLRDPESGKRLREALLLTPFARAEFESSFGNRYAQQTDPIERARLTLFRSLAGFGSAGFAPYYSTGFRGKSLRSFSTPAHDWASWQDALPAFTERLQGCVIERMPAVELIAKYDSEETLFYLDPPYVHDSRSLKSTGRYVHEMTDADHEQLGAALMKIKGRAVLSGYHSKLYDKLFKSWRCIEREALADGARKRTEVLWMNFNFDLVLS